MGNRCSVKPAIAIRGKRILFTHYWWAAILAILAILGLAWSGAFHGSWGAPITLVGAVISGVFFVQKQKLDELRLFRELFLDFNKRYDGLNDHLTSISDAGSLADSQERQWVIDYFNLCAEEFWWYCAGYIPESVWGSWCRGMLFYLLREPFRGLWEGEVKTNSYYGLTIGRIEAGAASPTELL